MDEESAQKSQTISSLIKSIKLSEETQKAIKNLKIPTAYPFIDNLDLLLKPVNFPTQKELNNYQSASALMEALSKEALRWKKQLPENYKPAIIALLYGGLQINVKNLSQVSFHGIQIEGTLNDSPCSLLAHQSTVQMLCFGAEITEEEPNRPIGFIWSGHSVEV